MVKDNFYFFFALKYKGLVQLETIIKWFKMRGGGEGLKISKKNSWFFFHMEAASVSPKKKSNWEDSYVKNTDVFIPNLIIFSFCETGFINLRNYRSQCHSWWRKLNSFGFLEALLTKYLSHLFCFKFLFLVRLKELLY